MILVKLRFGSNSEIFGVQTKSLSVNTNPSSDGTEITYLGNQDK